MADLLVEVLRGPLVDAVHRGDIAVVDARGSLRAGVGDPISKVAYWRSSAKPFQLMPLVYSGAARHWGLSEQDLAVIAGSHNGEPQHTSRVAALLERTGSQVDDLVCGAHPPLDPETAALLQRKGDTPSPLHSNCSGKHAGMLALARHMGAKPKDYELPGHPVQVEILQNVLRFSELHQEDVVIGIDGCGVPTFGISVYHMAFAFARLMIPSTVPPECAAASEAVRDSMMKHPYMVAGRNRFDTKLMQAARGRLLVKGGAGGVSCVGLPEGLGVAIKLEDGADAAALGRPSIVAAVEVLRQLDALDEEALDVMRPYARPTISSTAGRPVGEARPAFSLTPM